MAEPYLTDLTELTELWIAADDRLGALESRHFFSGAATYRDGSIAASLTPVGLAFKVPAEVREVLLERGLASPLRYFPNGHVKRDWVLFAPGTQPGADDAARLMLGESWEPE